MGMMTAIGGIIFKLKIKFAIPVRCRQECLVRLYAIMVARIITIIVLEKLSIKLCEKKVRR
jgi:hypothetical protein